VIAAPLRKKQLGEIQTDRLEVVVVFEVGQGSPPAAAGIQHGGAWGQAAVGKGPVRQI
jgi:hypothetical protein